MVNMGQVEIVHTCFQWHVPSMEVPMKRWHIEGIVNIANTSRHKLAVPRGDSRLTTLASYRTRAYKESLVLGIFRKAIGGLLRHL